MTTLRNILIGLMILISARLSAEPIGDIISYQGKLANPDGTPVANGTQTVTFKIYENGSAVFTQTSSVATVGGVFSVFLSVAGQVNFDPAKQYEMGVTSGGTETKSNIASVPVAKVAQVGVDNVKKSGDTMSGDLDMSGHSLANVRSVAGDTLDIRGTGNLYLQSFQTGTTFLGSGAGGHQDLSISGDIITQSVGTAAIKDAAVTQDKAPLLLRLFGVISGRSADAGKWLVQTGSSTPKPGVTGDGNVDFPVPFPNELTAVIVSLGDSTGPTSVITLSQYSSRYGFAFVALSGADRYTAQQLVRINWIAIGY